jgi:hypothetical protein
VICVTRTAPIETGATNTCRTSAAIHGEAGDAPPGRPPPATEYGCDKLVHCALHWFGGTFEHLSEWITRIGEIWVEKVATAADCDTAALSVLLGAERTVADALELRDDIAMADSNFTKLGAQLRAIRLAVRLANLGIVHALLHAANTSEAMSASPTFDEASVKAAAESRKQLCLLPVLVDNSQETTAGLAIPHRTQILIHFAAKRATSPTTGYGIDAPPPPDF